MARLNPFRPNTPVNPGMFVGRLREVERVEARLLQTRGGNPSHFMVTGERGIGKSSLLLYIKAVAQGEIPIDETTLRFLVVDTALDPSTSAIGLVKKIELSLHKTLEQSEPARQFFHKAWSFLQRVETNVVKIRFAPERASAETFLDEFAFALAETARRVTGHGGDRLVGQDYDGILLLIDEADGGANSLGLGSMVKFVCEALQRHGCGTVAIGLAGLSDLRDKLGESHLSSVRIFEENVLGRLTPEETGQVVDICIRKANEESGQRSKIASNARQLLVTLAEGYPHFVQQFGYSAFEADTDDLIDEEDVIRSAFGSRGAVELIGDRYYRDGFYKKIQKDSYRQVLRIMADRLDGWITKAEIREKFKGNQTTLDNAIHALRDRHLIIPKEGEKGVYRLQQKGFALWIKLHTSGPASVQETLAEQSKATS